MSDSEPSTVTYTSVSIPVEDDSDIGSTIAAGLHTGREPQYLPHWTVVPEQICTLCTCTRRMRYSPAKEQPTTLLNGGLTYCDSPGYVPELIPEEERCGS
ncbi:hypothetical protein Tco_0720926 [Tanacetum coccineum]